MQTKFGRFVLAVGTLGCALAIGSPVMAQGHGGGGGGHGGGGHAMGGGGHAVSGGVRAGGHFASAGRAYAGGYAGGYARGGAYGGRAAGYGAYAGHAASFGSAGGRVGGYGGGYYHGYSTGARWGGGYWGGGYWPRAYYGLGFSWFLPVLPLAYATYWYGGIPYYYANDVYYTYDPSYEGYVATDPPPVAAPSGSAVPPPASSGALPAAADLGGAGTQAMPGGQVFMYPKNGQSEAQQSTDKRECQQWATSQTDPSQVDDYRRAMIACIEGRGYSAQ